MSYTTLDVAFEPPLAVIRLNRPERMNAVIEAMYREIGDALEAADADPATRALILTGSVLKRGGVEKPAFCAGADLKEHRSGRRDRGERRRYIELAHRTMRALYACPKPTLAAVNGPARGAGTEMALCCDFILMAESATLAFPETGLGTFVGGGVTHILPRRVGLARAKELIYTGRVIDGAEAVALGIALSCHPSELLEAEARALAGQLAGKAPLSMALAKHLLGHSGELDLDAALREETEAILKCMESEDWREGLAAFAEKRKPRFTGR